MQFHISKDVFLKALTKVQGIIEKRHTIPILANVLIEANNGGIVITATDLEVGIKSSYQADVVTEGKVTVSAKKLFEIIKELPNKTIQFTSKSNFWVEITCGKSIFNLVGLSPDEFPKFPEVSTNLSKVEKEKGDYSWGGEAEKIYYALGEQAKPLGNEKVKEHFDKSS